MPYIENLSVEKIMQGSVTKIVTTKISSEWNPKNKMKQQQQHPKTKTKTKTPNYPVFIGQNKKPVKDRVGGGPEEANQKSGHLQVVFSAPEDFDSFFALW